MAGTYLAEYGRASQARPGRAVRERHPARRRRRSSSACSSTRSWSPRCGISPAGPAAWRWPSSSCRWSCGPPRRCCMLVPRHAARSGARRSARRAGRSSRWCLSRGAAAGMLTGMLLAVARISGETAPLLFTALNNQFWSSDMNAPMANLPVVIFQFAISPYEDWQQLGLGRRAADHRGDPVPEHPGRGLAQWSSLKWDEPACPAPNGATPDRARHVETMRSAAGQGAGGTAREDRDPRSTFSMAKFQALKTCQPDDARPPGDRLHRPVGLRQVDLAALPQPHVRLYPTARRPARS